MLDKHILPNSNTAISHALRSSLLLELNLPRELIDGELCAGSGKDEGSFSNRKGLPRTEFEITPDLEQVIRLRVPLSPVADSPQLRDRLCGVLIEYESKNDFYINHDPVPHIEICIYSEIRGDNPRIDGFLPQDIMCAVKLAEIVNPHAIDPNNRAVLALCDFSLEPLNQSVKVPPAERLRLILGRYIDVWTKMNDGKPSFEYSAGFGGRVDIRTALPLETRTDTEALLLHHSIRLSGIKSGFVSGHGQQQYFHLSAPFNQENYLAIGPALVKFYSDNFSVEACISRRF